MNSTNRQRTLKCPTRLGTDEDGYVINQTSIKHIQPEFETILFKSIELVKEAFDEHLHSITYMEASVAGRLLLVNLI